MVPKRLIERAAEKLEPELKIYGFVLKRLEQEARLLGFNLQAHTYDKAFLIEYCQALLVTAFAERDLPMKLEKWNPTFKKPESELQDRDEDGNNDHDPDAGNDHESFVEDSDPGPPSSGKGGLGSAGNQSFNSRSSREGANPSIDGSYGWKMPALALPRASTGAILALPKNSRRRRRTTGRRMAPNLYRYRVDVRAHELGALSYKLVDK